MTKTPKEIKVLLEVGFEYVVEKDGLCSSKNERDNKQRQPK